VMSSSRHCCSSHRRPLGTSTTTSNGPRHREVCVHVGGGGGLYECVPSDSSSKQLVVKPGVAKRLGVVCRGVV
jgi:hypothetical protein